MPPAAREPEAGRQPIQAPPLSFDEAELARVSARLVDRAAREARAAEAASPAARQAAALERLAAAFEAAVHARIATERDAVPRIVALAAAIGPMLGPTVRDPEGLAALTASMLAGLAVPSVRLSAAPEVVELLRPLLPEIVSRAAFNGTVELDAVPQLAEGALRLTWPNGWLARDPEDASRQVEALLAPLRAQPASDPLSLQGTPDDQS
jgi:hypothetical protein